MTSWIIISVILILLLIIGAVLLIGIGLPNAQTMALKISSPAFENGGTIPVKYTCDGENVSPPLEFAGLPPKTRSLVLLMDDPDIPDSVKRGRGIEVFDHWVVFNILPETVGLEEGREPPGISGANSSGRRGYTGPCPPDREHRYFFKLYALDAALDLPAGAAKAEVEKAMAGHILDQAQLIGLYKTKNL